MELKEREQFLFPKPDGVGLSPIDKKRNLLGGKLRKIRNLKKLYHQKTSYYQKLNSRTEVLIIGCGTIGTSTLILSFSAVGSPLIIVSAVFNSLSTLGTALKKASNINSKYESHKATWLSYCDLERDLRFTFTKNGMNAEQYDAYITDIDNRLDLIENNSIPVSVTRISDSR